MNDDDAINILKEKMDEGYVLLDTKIDFDKSEEKRRHDKNQHGLLFCKT